MKAYIIRSGTRAKVIRKSDGATHQSYRINEEMLFVREDVMIDPVILHNKNYTQEAAPFIKEAKAGNIVFKYPGIFDKDAQREAKGEMYWVIVPNGSVIVG